MTIKYNDLTMFLNCTRCYGAKPPSVSAKEWNDTQTALTTDLRLAVWCNRCETPVAVLELSQRQQIALMEKTCGGCGSGGHA